MFGVGEIVSYTDMCQAEKLSLQQGMNFREYADTSVLLMSLRKGAPYSDAVAEGGRVLIYEGHDAPKRAGHPDPKTVDQPDRTPTGGLTQNGRFALEAERAAVDPRQARRVRVYEKLRPAIWVFNGTFGLMSVSRQTVELPAPPETQPKPQRLVFKFRLELVQHGIEWKPAYSEMQQTRVIPSEVKQKVFLRDGGKCVLCSAKDNLHFDHDLPYSLGGSSLLEENIRLLCARHNLAKGARLE